MYGRYERRIRNLNRSIRRSRHSSVGIGTAYGLDGRGVGFRVQVGGKIFLLSTSSRDRLGAHPASYPMATGGSFPGGGGVVKRSGREAGQSPPSNAVAKKTWLYTSTPPYTIMV
jgi:hypothetical protein